MINLAHAQEAVAVAQSFVAQINQIILFPLITLMTVIALIVFLWGGFEYVNGATNPTAREQGRKHLLWGVIGLLVMLSAFSILSIAARTFSLDVEEPATSTRTNTQSGSPDFGAIRPAPRPDTFDQAAEPEPAVAPAVTESTITSETLPPLEGCAAIIDDTGEVDGYDCPQ